MSDADPLNPHSHEPSPEPPSPDPTLTILWSHGRSQPISITQLQQFTAVTLENCTIVSTGHGTSGPFSFTGPPLLDVVEAYAPAGWSQVEVVSGDGFGTRIFATELTFPHAQGPIILAHTCNGRSLTRQEGLVRLIVPSETDDALRQVKWVQLLRVL